jgi:DNA-binding Xre family transcriptional regulator
VVIAIIDFSPLWDTMKQKKISQYYLLKQGIDNKTLDSLKKNKNITLNTLEKLCQILDCEDLNKIVKFID